MLDPNYAIAIPIAYTAILADGVAMFFRSPVNPPTPEARLSSTDIAQTNYVKFRVLA